MAEDKWFRLNREREEAARLREERRRREEVIAASVHRGDVVESLATRVESLERLGNALISSENELKRRLERCSQLFRGIICALGQSFPPDVRERDATDLAREGLGVVGPRPDPASPREVEPVYGPPPGHGFPR